MSLGIVIKCPEGLVLAAESRITLGAHIGAQQLPVTFDNATKLLSFSSPNNTIGVVTYGQAVIGQRDPRTAASFIPEFEASLPKERLSVVDFAEKISSFFLKQWQSNMPPDDKIPNMTFVVAGFNPDEVYGQVFLIEIPRIPKPTERSKVNEFGITFGGQHEIVSRILKGYDTGLPEALQKGLNLTPEQITKLDALMKQFQIGIPLQVLALQDCVDLACFFIRTTMDTQKFSVGLRGVGGAIDVAIIKRNQNLQFVQRKQVHGEISQ
ncbi:MAG: hypothetical protein WC370_11115 [Dehalococcoidales bacterium]|jgi:hypothetical protein